MVKLIKRYANRKLYDTDASSYVTLEDVHAMVRRGEEIRILDNATKEDITHATLAQILFEQERAESTALPLSSLKTLLQSGEGFWQRLQSPVHQFRDEVRRRAEALEEGGKALRDFVDATQRSMDELQQRLDERFRDAFDQLTHIPELRREVTRLQQQVGDLEARLRRIEGDAARARAPRPGTAFDPGSDLPG